MEINNYIIYGSSVALGIMAVVFSILFYRLGKKTPQIIPYGGQPASRKVKPVNIKADKIAKEPEKIYNSFNIMKSKPIYSPKRWKDFLKEKFFPERSVLINMELMNGFHKSFLVIETDDGFKYRGKKYIFDTENKYYNMDAKLWTYDFHESLTLPLVRKIPVGKIKTIMEQSGISEVEYMLNPSTLERFTIAKIAEGIMKGQQIEEFFKRFQLMLIITMIACILHLLIFMFKSGMLQSISLPFLS